MLVTSCYAPTDLQIYTKGEIARTRLILRPLFSSKKRQYSLSSLEAGLWPHLHFRRMFVAAFM